MVQAFVSQLHSGIDWVATLGSSCAWQIPLQNPGSLMNDMEELTYQTALLAV